MDKFKVITAAILALLALIIVLQNTENVDTKILFMTISLPRAALLFGTMVIGFIVGVMVAGRLLGRNRNQNTAAR